MGIEQPKTQKTNPELDQFKSQLEALQGQVDLEKMRQGLMKDLDELGITDATKREEYWQTALQEFRKKEVMKSGEFKDVDAFVTNVENLTGLKSIIDSKQPIKALAEKGFFKYLWEYFAGDKKEKEAASKALLAMIGSWFGIKNLLGSEEEATVASEETDETKKPANPETAPKNADLSLVQAFVNKYNLDKKEGGAADQALKRLRNEFGEQNIKDWMLEALKTTSNVQKIYTAVKTKLNNNAINPSVYDIRLGKLKSPDAVIAKINSMLEPTEAKIRAFLDKINPDAEIEIPNITV